MPEGTLPPITETDEESIPFFVPKNKHDAGLRISAVGRHGRRRMRAEAQYDKRIARLNKKLAEVKKRKSEELIKIDEDAALPANELMAYLRLSWPALTNNGMTKLIRFFS